MIGGLNGGQAKTEIAPSARYLELIRASRLRVSKSDECLGSSACDF